jgi:zinc-ribbon family
VLIIGMRFVTWGSAGSGRRMHCGQCGTVGEFIDKKGMRFITLFFIPVIPISGTKHLLQCPTCGTRYQAS